MSEAVLDAEGLRKKLADARRQHSRLSGRREQELTDLTRLQAAVAKAKGELELKKLVEARLEQIQTRLHQRTIGRYEDTLTALTDDVIADGTRIKLRLRTERGAPALDINAQVEELEHDILEGAGGALDNVVSLGLRLIGVVRSRQLQFVALDEPDHWVELDRVADFWGVLGKMGSRLGLQTLAISHRDIALFPRDINLIRIGGNRLDGLTVTPDDKGAAWASDDQPGIRYIHLTNFAGFADNLIPLGPGMNVIQGPNNLGKSRVIRALRCVCYGEGDDGDIRGKAAFAQVVLGIAKGHSIRWSRQPGRNPVTLWEHLDEHGRPVETGRRDPPEWLSRVLNIGEVEGLRLHVAHQKQPVFLLNDPATKRATVLSLAGESGYLRTMFQTYKDASARRAQTVKHGEAEVCRLLKSLEASGALEGLAARLEAAEQGLKAAMEKLDAAGRMHATARTLEHCARAARVSKARADVLSNLRPAELDGIPERLRSAASMRQQAEGLADLQVRKLRAARQSAVLGRMPASVLDLPPTTPMRLAADAIEVAGTAWARSWEMHQALSRLPEPMGSPPSSGALIQAAGHLEQLARLHAGQVSSLAEVERQRAAVAKLRSGLLAEVGHLCPLCGNHMDDEQAMKLECGHG